MHEHERRRAPSRPDEVQGLFLDCRAVRRDQLLLQLRRRGLVMAELQAIGAVAGGDRFEPRRKMLELGERRLRGDLHQARTRRIVLLYRIDHFATSEISRYFQL